MHTSEVTVAVMAAFLVLVLFAGLRYHLNTIERRTALIARVDAKLDLLLKHAGLTYDPYEKVSASVMEAVKAGRKIEAIKRYRKETNVGLADAKEYVEGVQRKAGLS